MNTKERLITFITKVQGTSEPNISQFEKKCGLTNAYVKNIRKSIGEDSLNKILKEYPYLNKYWLLHGDGEMLLNTTKNNNTEAGQTLDNMPENNIDRSKDTHLALLSLIDSNKIYAENYRDLITCHKDLTASHVKAVDLNVELAAMLKLKITDNEIRDILEDDGARLRVFQELLIQIGLGKGWASEEEGRAEIHKLVSDALLKV